jgi:uncharacterized membrane protein YGL010W
MRPNLLRWQWEGYPAFHTTRLNLLIHIVAVPSFIASLISLVFAIATMRWILALECVLGLVIAFAAQGFGHKREPAPPIPFDGPIDAITRIFAEQLVTFPRFVLSGKWSKAPTPDR